MYEYSTYLHQSTSLEQANRSKRVKQASHVVVGMLDTLVTSHFFAILYLTFGSFSDSFLFVVSLRINVHKYQQKCVIYLL